ncbi:sensor histidine kinase [Sulfobacillus harzensis]|uniref:histidine kinase n=1 Tax=Sulfobacillus harzensis TaxID=2729629 RepID=A0A7Y0Q0X9_9FIRM|nr:HAMP domain-containing sensor histidine kinase [Sulfobacillus harzensis]NMP21513.1 HAMP domain-containing histidine kinase [Sulfobacillus harzensis]
MRRSAPTTESRLLRRLQWRMALSFAIAFLVFDIVVVGLTYEVLQYHFYSEAKATIQHVWSDRLPDSVPPSLPPDQDGEINHPGDSLPRVATWQFNAAGKTIRTMPTLYGFPAPSSTILPNRALLSQMPHTHSTLWAVARYQSYRVMIGSKPVWNDGRYLGALQSAYSMGRLTSVMRGLLAVDAEVSLVMAALIVVLVLWLSGRSLGPIREALGRQRAFVQDVSHELRTPLTIVKSSLELALQETERSNVDYAIRDVISEVDYITRLTHDLAALARVGSGSTEIQPSELNLFDLADDVIAALTPLAEERGVTLDAKKTGPNPVIVADPTFVRQLLIILLDNALKYNHPGGRAELAVRVLDETVHVRVSDTGSGIPKEDLPHLFDRFYRSRTASRLAPGSGLGLAIARWIIDAHAGTIRAESELGRGTEVVAEWPRRVP